MGADEVDETTSAIASQPIPQVSVYPNPTSGGIFLRLPSPARVKLYDLSGTLLYEVGKTENGTHLRLPVPAGVYLLHLIGEGWQTSTRLLVQP